MEIVAAVIGLCVIASCAYYFLTLPARQRAEEDERLRREAYAKRRGWRHESMPDGDIRYRFYGTTPGGKKWRLEYDSNYSSSDPQPRFRWRCETDNKSPAAYLQLGPPGSILFGAAPVNNPLFARAIGAVVGATAGSAFRNAVGEELHSQLAAEAGERQAFLESAVTLPSANREFTETFQVIVADPVVGQNIFAADVQRALLVWSNLEEKIDPGRSVTLDGIGGKLTLLVYYRGFDSELCEHMVFVGGKIAENVMKSGGDVPHRLPAR